MWVQALSSWALVAMPRFRSSPFVTHFQPPPSAITRGSYIWIYLSWPLEVPWSRVKGGAAQGRDLVFSLVSVAVTRLWGPSLRLLEVCAAIFPGHWVEFEPTERQ